MKVGVDTVVEFFSKAHCVGAVVLVSARTRHTCRGKSYQLAEEAAKKCSEGDDVSGDFVIIEFFYLDASRWRQSVMR